MARRKDQVVTEEEYTDITEISDSIFLCKAFWSHAWSKNPSPQNIDSDIARMADVMLCLRCTRCKRERYDYIGRNGELIGRYYKNPIGYPKTHHFHADGLRAEMIRRSILVERYNGKKGK